ncbi:MAG: GDYXXLXY domain-containing protein [Saprospiraceae bacterium]|nr:GDYXXLXY domain-containing protein [Saprospiraceae bacterium]
MNLNKIIFPSFLLLAIIQLSIPVKMIMDQEGILNSGTEFRMKAMLAYPESGLSGRYIRVSYENEKFPIGENSSWQKGEIAFVVFKSNEPGFASIDTILKSKPEGSSNYVKAKVKYIQKDQLNEVYLEFPFEKFFLEETRLNDQSMQNLRSRSEQAKMIYSIVRIKDGEAAIKDILIDDQSLLELE